MALRLIKFAKRHGSLFPGDIGGYEDPQFSELIRKKYGHEVDVDGNRIDAPLAEPEDEKKPEGDGYVFKESTDPFCTDGISKTASQALHARGLHTVEAVREFIAAGNDVNAIDHVTDAQAEKIVKLYASAS
jgi:hypothetical protein